MLSYEMYGYNSTISVILYMMINIYIYIYISVTRKIIYNRSMLRYIRYVCPVMRSYHSFPSALLSQKYIYIVNTERNELLY